MNRCAFIGEEQTFVVLSEDIDALEKAMDEVKEEYPKVEKENLARFVAIYRELLGIPADATIDEERDYLHSEYGEQPMDNEEFVELMREARRNYEDMRAKVDWKLHFEEKGFETEDLTHYIVIGKGEN